MGVSISNFVFEEDIPQFKKIQNQFKIQTGLHLSFSADLNMVKLSSDIHQIQEKLVEDYHQVSVLKQKMKNDFSNKSLRESLEKLNFISDISLQVWGFVPIEFIIKNKMIELEYFIGDYYAIESLKKVLHDLGGKRCDTEGKIDSDWTPPKHWKKLKKWSEYRWYNRPKK